MLKQRILTALILIPIFVALVLKLPVPAFCVLVSLIVIWGSWEWSLFMGVTKFPQCFFYPITMVLILLAFLLLPIPVHLILYAACLFWLVALVLVCLYPKASQLWGKSILIRALMGVFVLVPCWTAVNFIRTGDYGTYKLLYLFVLIWGADSGAYFAGRLWGKHKLAPQVSPGKTLQGLAGALVTSIAITFIAFYVFDIPQDFWLAAILLSLTTVLFSVLGDLFESMLKRNAGLKDSGQLLPGHGGILDRIDSLTAAAPIFIVCEVLMQKFFF